MGGKYWVTMIKLRVKDKNHELPFHVMPNFQGHVWFRVDSLGVIKLGIQLENENKQARHIIDSRDTRNSLPRPKKDINKE